MLSWIGENVEAAKSGDMRRVLSAAEHRLSAAVPLAEPASEKLTALLRAAARCACETPRFESREVKVEADRAERGRRLVGQQPSKADRFCRIVSVSVARFVLERFAGDRRVGEILASCLSRLRLRVGGG